jgi:hypothetical protein
LDFGVRNSDYAHFNKINLLAEHKLDPGIAIFGSSVSEVGLDPKIFKKTTGLETYNFSIDGTGFEQINGLLKEFSKSSKDCKVVVLTEFFVSFQKLNQLTEVQRFAGHIANENIYRSLHAIQPDLAWKIRNVPFYEFIVVEHPFYKASLLGWKKKLLKQSQPIDTTMGFFPKDLSWDPGLDSVNKKTNPITINIDQEIVEEYGKTLQLLKKNGRKLVIILPPVQKDGKALIKNVSAFKAVCKKFVSEDIYFLDCYDLPLSENKSFFYNNAHVNRSGSLIFSQHVADFVNGILNDKN